VAPFTDKLAIIDRVGATLRRYPIAVSAIAGGVALLGSRGILSWAARALAVYSLFRKI